MHSQMKYSSFDFIRLDLVVTHQSIWEVRETREHQRQVSVFYARNPWAVVKT